MPDTLTAPMPTRPLGRTGHNASVLTLGGVKWDTQIPESDAIALVHRAIDLGINTIDTAASYGGGKSETRLGLALEGRRDKVFICTKSPKRTRDAARKDFDTSLQRLKTNTIDLMYVHGIGDHEDDLEKVLGPDSVLKALDEYRAAGHIRHVGVSGHHRRGMMEQILKAYKFDAVLLPAGVFNLAYKYNFIDVVGPQARSLGMAILGMKVFGAGRAKHAASIEPYLRYSLNCGLDTCVIGADSIAQLEQTIRIVKAKPGPLTQAEQESLYPEIMEITKEWGHGEFNWVKHYVEHPLA